MCGHWELKTLLTYAGDLLGQGIVIYGWEFEDGTTGGPNAEAKAAEELSAEALAQRVQSAGMH